MWRLRYGLPERSRYLDTLIQASADMPARVFDDDVLDPGASLRRTLLVRLPRGTTAVDLRVILPLLTKRPEGLFRGRRLAWEVGDALDSPMPLLCPASAPRLGAMQPAHPQTASPPGRNSTRP